MVPGHIREYELKFTLPGRPLVSSDLGGVEQVVVIPALAERDTLPATLASLARNAGAELGRTLVLCVINNRGPHAASPRDIKNNQETIRYLHSLIKGVEEDFPGDGARSSRGREILQSPLRLTYIDASSPGREMPDKCGGVGAARKIGLDSALQLFDYGLPQEKLLISLDADSLVADNYLAAIRSHFGLEKTAAAVVNYRHQQPFSARHQLAIRNYDIFLHYYVLGLRYAGSPYAFHTIGSTMVCTADAYVAVGGMNRRDAAEDFYFLNKLAKYQPISCIRTTTVCPSARPSRRVPFGTGKRVIRFLEAGEKEWQLYDPRIFSLLQGWLRTMNSFPERDTEGIMAMAGLIDPLLPVFLEANQFPVSWSRIRKNCRQRAGLLRQFHSWFDAFKTLKMVHFLTDHGFPQVDMFTALEGLFQLMSSREKDPAS